ncbi:cytochrome P450 family protein [Bombardia bombarda]|uniref:Cytochrome P450 family protein n=1 Tax=Bombardia bombarda TaxID=252184 RepID=A0AA39WCJ8_9PEZI|nr:cytochrome P450 family protein [Bombardia bombarda]
MALLTGAALFGSLVSLVIYLIATRYLRWKRLSHIPGPPLAGWSKLLWMAPRQIGGGMCNDLHAVCGKYGPLSRIGPDWLVCSDPAEIRRLWSVHSGYHRSPWYRGFRFDPRSDNILTINENKEHHRLRSHLLPGYSGKGLADQEQVVDENLGKFIGLIERKYLSSHGVLRPMDMQLAFQCLTQDVTTAVEFGRPFGYIEADGDFMGVIEAMEAMLVPTQMAAMFPAVLGLVKSSVFEPFMPKEQVGGRYGEGKVRKRDVLQAFVDSGMTRSEVESEAVVHLVAGTDTTAAAIRTAIFYLSTSPGAYGRLQREIDGAVERGLATRPIVADGEAKGLVYLQAVIREALRMWPPITGLLAKVSGREDVVCGRTVPAGTHVAWAAMGIMKNKAVFGEDAETFQPERWLEAEPERVREMEAVQGLVFAAGTRWECLGMRLAGIELNKTIFELMLRFDFAMVNPIRPFKWNNQGFTVCEGMDLKITKREEAR